MNERGIGGVVVLEVALAEHFTEREVMAASWPCASYPRVD
jgi:hypothetical protein